MASFRLALAVNSTTRLVVPAAATSFFSSFLACQDRLARLRNAVELVVGTPADLLDRLGRMALENVEDGLVAGDDDRADVPDG